MQLTTFVLEKNFIFLDISLSLQKINKQIDLILIKDF